MILRIISPTHTANDISDIEFVVIDLSKEMIKEILRIGEVAKKNDFLNISKNMNFNFLTPNPVGSKPFLEYTNNTYLTQSDCAVECMQIVVCENSFWASGICLDDTIESEILTFNELGLTGKFMVLDNKIFYKQCHVKEYRKIYPDRISYEFL